MDFFVDFLEFDFKPIIEEFCELLSFILVTFSRLLLKLRSFCLKEERMLEIKK
jgi:hypothetical protein